MGLTAATLCGGALAASHSKEAVFPVKRTKVSSGRDTLKATVAQDYCWMWTNKGSAPVSLTVDLAR